MRILIGTFEIGRFVHDIADGLRKLGHEVDTLITVRNPYHAELEYSYEYDQGNTMKQLGELIDNPVGTFLFPSEDLISLRLYLTAYDLYIFNFASSILSGNADLPILKKLGKRVISVFMGSDIRHWSGAEPVAEAYGYEIPEMYRSEPYNNLNQRLHNLRIAERYSDAVFSLPFQSELAVRPYYHIFLPLDLSQFNYQLKGREVPVIVHAPTRRGFKGTAEFLRVLDELRRDGIAFDLRLLEGIPNAQVRKEMEDADVVLDQLNSPHYANAALEGMLTGCAVVGGNEPNYVPYVANSPVYAVNKENLYQKLRLLLTQREIRLDYATRGRTYAEKNHGHIDVARYLLSKLDPTDDHLYFPTYYSKEYVLPEREEISDRVKVLTGEIVQRYGLPERVSLSNLTERNLVDENSMDRSRPICHWKPRFESVKIEKWGWCVDHHVPDSPQIEDPSATVLELVRQAIERSEMKQQEEIRFILEHCIALVREYPEIMNIADVLVGMGRLYFELGESEMASDLYTSAIQLDSSLEDVSIARSSIQQNALSWVDSAARGVLKP